MKGAIFYYSATGNTKLACEYIAKKVDNIDFEVINICKTLKHNMDEYDLVGFACPTFYLSIPDIFSDFINKLIKQKNKPAFIFTTYGLMFGKSLKKLKQLLNNKGFKIFDGMSFLMPESFPPYIVKNYGNPNAPEESDLNQLENFIKKIEKAASNYQKENKVSVYKIKTGFFNSIIPTPSNEKIMKNITGLQIEKSKCTKCGLCEVECPSAAIQIKPIIKIENKKCSGCWKCFNLCPEKAIKTEKLAGIGHYAGPSKKLKSKLR